MSTVIGYYVGIDLGSTTTKAVILDSQSRILGRGITNSRSNYDVACAVALTEALTNTRFELMAQELEKAGVTGERKDALLEVLGLGFKQQQYLASLSVLETVFGDLLEERAASPALRECVARITSRMAVESDQLFSVDGERKSDFFRDLAGSRYLQLAEAAAEELPGTFDSLVGLFDKAILRVENALPEDEHFQAHVLEAMRKLGNVDDAVRTAVETASAIELETMASVGTGYGRQRLPFPKAQIRSEILCHGLGAHAMFPNTRTVLDIGGQDTKAIQVDNKGIVTSFQMNDRCAAGCGRYLGYIADEMNLGLHELGPLAKTSCRTVKINSTCTVFAGAELRERLALGEKREDILAGLHRAIILRAMSLLARSGGVESEFTFTGGVAKNPAAVEALEKLIAENYGKVRINISPDSIYTGALGAAMFALRAWQDEHESGEAA